MSHVDEGELARLMDVLPDALAREELVVQRSLPHLSPADVLDTALRRALTRLRVEVSRDTFELLRWRVALARAERRRQVEHATVRSASTSRAAVLPGAGEELQRSR